MKRRTMRRVVGGGVVLLLASTSASPLLPSVASDSAVSDRTATSFGSRVRGSRTTRPSFRTSSSTLLQRPLRGGAAGSDSTRPWSSAGSRWGRGAPTLQEQSRQSQQRRGQRDPRQGDRTYPTVEDITDVDEKNDEIRKAAEREETKEAMEAFLTRDSRNKFIARVYAILSGQLLVTAMSIFLFGTNPGLASWVLHKGRAVLMGSLVISTVAYMFMCTSERARRESPLKWRLLALFTAGEALSVGFISSFYTFRSVLSAMMATSVATMSVTMYTLMQKNPKYDLSLWGRGLSSAGMIFLVYGVIHLLELFGILPTGFLPYSEVLYSLCGSILFSFYLAYHTRLIVSGKHTKLQMNEKDYVFGAMSLYNDVINIFIYLLRLLGEDRD